MSVLAPIGSERLLRMLWHELIMNENQTYIGVMGSHDWSKANDHWPLTCYEPM